MIMQKLTCDLQNICHEGESGSDVVIKILDSFYKVGKIVPYVLPSGKKVYAISGEVWNGKDQSNNED